MRVLFLAQLYNFIVGFSLWIILFIIMVVNFGILKCGNVLFLLLIFSAFLTLLIPVNMHITRRKNIDVGRYVILSILIVALGAIINVIISNIINEVI